MRTTYEKRITKILEKEPEGTVLTSWSLGMRVPGKSWVFRKSFNGNWVSLSSGTTVPSKYMATTLAYPRIIWGLS